MAIHHFIPKFILKGFSFNPKANKNEQLITIYNKKTNKFSNELINFAFAEKDFNSEETETILGEQYENIIARVFQRIQKRAYSNESDVVLSNEEYRLLFRFFTIMWRRNDIQLEKINEMAININNEMETMFGNNFKNMLRPEYQDKNLADLIKSNIENIKKPLYDKIIKDTTDDDETVQKTILNYIPTIVYNKSNVHFLLHNTYGTLRYIKKANEEIQDYDLPYTFIEPISKDLCFCLLLTQNQIDIKKDKYKIKIEVWDNDEDIIKFFIKDYLTDTATNYVVDETNYKYVTGDKHEQ